jgi:hypothetical protein
MTKLFCFHTEQPEHESLGSKLKTVDFTAQETGDTLEQLLKLLDPELQDKKRGEVDKMNNSQLDEKAESKLASLTKKAEDEVDKLAAENPKLKTGFLSFVHFDIQPSNQTLVTFYLCYSCPTNYKQE